MAIAAFLAMTAAEILSVSLLPPKIAWMACHFSPYGTGLSSLPEALPEGSLLILNDRIPWQGHDPDRIAAQLQEVTESLSCHGLLLDFQRPGVPEVAELVHLLCTHLPCPVGVAEAYCADLSCPVFLPPVPLQQPVEEYLQPWQGREIWLELALNAEEILLTPEGAVTSPLPPWDIPEPIHHDTQFHYHYSVKLEENSARFTLSRTREDLEALLKEAAQHGVTMAAGLWQELDSWTSIGADHAPSLL